LLAEKELLANVSHELRTPLARIRVALDLASEGDADAARASLSEIAVDLGELEALIDDVLTATRFEIAEGSPRRAGLPVHLEEVEPRDVTARAAERFRAAHPERPLEVVVDPDLPRLEADPMLLRRVLDNVLENAHKYTPDPKSAVTLRARAHAPGVRFTVEDRGAGIAREDLEHVFTPFFRADRSRSRGTGGVGLGLTLAKRIVEAHGGTIAVVSVRGEGTTVHVDLPAS
jgi:signal transduction histidine kinase